MVEGFDPRHFRQRRQYVPPQGGGAATRGLYIRDDPFRVGMSLGVGEAGMTATRRHELGSYFAQAPASADDQGTPVGELARLDQRQKRNGCGLGLCRSAPGAIAEWLTAAGAVAAALGVRNSG